MEISSGPGTPTSEDILAIANQQSMSSRLNRAPLWLVAFFVIIIGVGFLIVFNSEYRDAFDFIKIGIIVTISSSLIAYTIAIFIGLFVGLGRMSSNIIINNIATFYVEIVRGIPILVLIFYIALVVVPFVAGLLSLNIRDVPMLARAVIALAVTYGAFLAEIFRAGIQSIPRGQMEAARSLGMSYPQAMINVILPQAVRNVLPALGNDFVAMLKDSSLVSVLAVRDITQVARLYAGASFRFTEAYTTLAVMYLTMTVALSLLIGQVERRMRSDG